MGFFDGVEQVAHPTSAGPCDLPILYREGSMTSVLFRVHPDRAAAALAPHNLDPMVIASKTLAVLAVFEYRDSTVGVYNELGIGVHAKRPGTTPNTVRMLSSQMRSETDQALCVLSLPVTTPSACAAGIDLWGYPKYVTDIHLEFQARSTRCTLGHELEFTLAHRRGLTTPALPLVTFSDRGSVRTVVEIGSRTRWSIRPSFQMTIQGQGQSADIATQLGLHHTSPLAAFRTDSFQAILPEGVRRARVLETRGRQQLRAR